MGRKLQTLEQFDGKIYKILKLSLQNQVFSIKCSIKLDIQVKSVAYEATSYLVGFWFRVSVRPMIVINEQFNV